MNFNRSRWAAFGAATAVVAGAGGIGFAQAADTAAPSSFVSNVSCRVLDTRTDPSIGMLGAGDFLTLDTLDTCDIPANATGLSVNIAAVAASSNTFLTAYPTGAARPGTSMLNVTKGVTISNGVDVSLSDDGKFDIYNQSGNVQVIVDVLGAYVPAASGTGSAGSDGTQGPKGDAGATGEQGPAGDAAAGFRMVPVEIEMDLDEFDLSSASYQWAGPLDVCEGGILLEAEVVRADDVADGGVYIFSYADDEGPRRMGEGGGYLLNNYDSISAWAEFVRDDHADPEAPWADTALLDVTVVCGPALPLDGTFDDVADNDIDAGYGPGAPS